MSRQGYQPDPILEARLAAARGGNHEEFSRLIEPYRRELQVHCYRLLGSFHDAEDLTQETLLRAWRKLDTYAGQASLRAWLYKIATNACLDELKKRPRRALVQASHPSTDPQAPLAPPIVEPVWLEPYPDEWLPEATAAGPEARYSAHESISLAFLAALQILPPRQRAILILGDVLDWRASEVAELLGLTVSAVNSALHRARVTLAAQYGRDDGHDPARSMPADAQLRTLLNQYVQAWETADIARLVGLLKEAAVFAMPPTPSWYAGRDNIGQFVGLTIFAEASPLFAGQATGRWRLQPARVNGQPAFAVYQRDDADAAITYRAFGLQVLTLETEGIAAVTSFMNPQLVIAFGLPAEIKP
ncbi:MAG: sigma-70 family RNA polymerase sigma factor [Anaerolineales bacterium]